MNAATSLTTYVDIPLDDDIPVGEVVDSSFGEFEAAVAQLSPPAATQPLGWPGAPLTQHQLIRRMAQEEAMRAGSVARFPEGLQ